MLYVNISNFVVKLTSFIFLMRFKYQKGILIKTFNDKNWLQLEDAFWNLRNLEKVKSYFQKMKFHYVVSYFEPILKEYCTKHYSCSVSFLLTNTSKLVVGLVILSCKSQVFSIISEFEHHFQTFLFVKSTILRKSIF